jgi:hypothetical protein
VTLLFFEPVSFTTITADGGTSFNRRRAVNVQFTLERNNTVLGIKPANPLPAADQQVLQLTGKPSFGLTLILSSCYFA